MLLFRHHYSVQTTCNAGKREFIWLSINERFDELVNMKSLQCSSLRKENVIGLVWCRPKT